MVKGIWRYFLNSSENSNSFLCQETTWKANFQREDDVIFVANLALVHFYLLNRPNVIRYVLSLTILH